MNLWSAEARSVRGEVESKVAMLAAKADASTAHAIEEIEGRVREVAAYSDAEASRVAETVTQQLEREIHAAATSTAVTVETQTRTAVEAMHRDVQAQFGQNRADALRREEESQHKVEQIAERLQKLTDQPNQFRPASEENVSEMRKQVFEQFEQRLELQSSRIDVVNESVKKSQKLLKIMLNCYRTCLWGLKTWGRTLRNSGKIWNSGKVQIIKIQKESMHR